MAFEAESLDRIFSRTSGYCHICHKKLCRKNYGKHGARGAWEVEHSVPQSKGGTDRFSNLYAAHIRCNRQKSDYSTRTARAWNGRTRAPLSQERRDNATRENTFWGAIAVGFAGLCLGGPVLGLAGLFAGGHLGRSLNPDKTG